MKLTLTDIAATVQSVTIFKDAERAFETCKSDLTRQTRVANVIGAWTNLKALQEHYGFEFYSMSEPASVRAAQSFWDSCVAKRREQFITQTGPLPK